MTETEIADLFRKNNFRVTPQRIAVYKYLCENRTHPDADEIYKNVARTNPSFSKTTVYNSLLALEKHGLVERINIDSERVRYDAYMNLHGHFFCSKCNTIYDFAVEKVLCSLPEPFEVDEQNVYYRGVCPECK